MKFSALYGCEIVVRKGQNDIVDHTQTRKERKKALSLSWLHGRACPLNLRGMGSSSCQFQKTSSLAAHFLSARLFFKPTNRYDVSWTPKGQLSTQNKYEKNEGRKKIRWWHVGMIGWVLILSKVVRFYFREKTMHVSSSQKQQRLYNTYNIKKCMKSNSVSRKKLLEIKVFSNFEKKSPMN